MKLPISRFLTLLCIGLSLSHAYAQQNGAAVIVKAERVEVTGQNLEQAVSEKVLKLISAVEPVQHVHKVAALPCGQQVLASLEPLKSLNALEPLEGLEAVEDPGDGQDCAQPSEMQGYASTVSKKITKSFKVNSSDKLSIDNQFGRVEVQTWGKNEIAVDVTLTASAPSEATAQNILDHINIRISEAADLIAFVTEWRDMQIRSGAEKSFQINYLVRMPKANPLRVSNKYGAVQLPDMDGPVELAVKYGRFTAGNLNNRQNSVLVQYSGAECQLGYMRGGDLNVKYSSLHMNGADAIQANTAYSKVTIDKIDALTVESKYDQAFRVGNAGQISGTGGYSSFIIGNLRESAGMTMKYSKFEVGSIAQSFKKIDLNGGYTRIELGFADNSAFNFDIDTQYSNVKMNQDLADFSFREVRNTSATYRGKYGKTSPKGLVNITSRYGPVLFN